MILKSFQYDFKVILYGFYIVFIYGGGLSAVRLSMLLYQIISSVTIFSNMVRAVQDPQAAAAVWSQPNVIAR